MIELEKTYLLKYIPKDLNEYDSKEIVDIYIPKSSRHAVIRIRKSDDKYEITKKEPISDDDASCQKEQTIRLTEEEFNEFKKLDGKIVHKTRYCYEYDGRKCEVDVFQGALKGLVVVDFEFETNEEKDAFEIPSFCLIEITQEEFIAGGMICGKSYNDIEEPLKKFNYVKLELESS